MPPKPVVHPQISETRGVTEKAELPGTAQPLAHAEPPSTSMNGLAASGQVSAPEAALRPPTLEEARRLREAGDAGEAATVLVELIAREPERVDAIMTLANLYLSGLNEPDKALSLYRRALALDPKRASTHVNLGVYYLRMGDPTKALEYLERALTLNPNLAEAHYNLACFHATEGDPLRAQRSLKRAVELDSRCAQWAQEDPDLLSLRKAAQEMERESP